MREAFCYFLFNHPPACFMTYNLDDIMRITFFEIKHLVKKQITAYIAILLFFLYIIFSSNISSASNDPRFVLRSGCLDEYTNYKELLKKKDFNHCSPTKAATNDYEPKRFASSNNLLRKNGQEPLFCGEKILVKGRVLDSNCVPISDAKIYLWQAGCDGKYPYEPLRKKINRKNLNVSKNQSTFQGNGVATTNNNGEFTFITVYPGKMNHVNFRIVHSDFDILQTKFILSNASLESDSVYYLDIVLHGKNKHRRY